MEERIMNNTPIRVLVVDDHPVVRDGLKLTISVSPGLQWVGQADNGEAGVESCASLQPDVVLMDLMMPKMDGVAATQIIRQRHPDIKIVVLTSFDDKNLVQRALRAGATSYMMKNASMETLVDTIQNAYLGRSTLAPEVMQALAQEEDWKAENELTNRELEILTLLAQGMTNAAIAKKLFISEATARFHVSNILAKLGASNRTEAVRIALERRLVPSK
jgi:NarL family two-component system response regulator LiaR